MTSRNWRDELVPNIIDHIAEVDPEALYAEYPVSTLTYDHSYRKITFGDFARRNLGSCERLRDSSLYQAQ